MNVPVIPWDILTTCKDGYHKIPLEVSGIVCDTSVILSHKDKKVLVSLSDYNRSAQCPFEALSIVTEVESFLHYTSVSWQTEERAPFHQSTHESRLQQMLATCRDFVMCLLLPVYLEAALQSVGIRYISNLYIELYIYLQKSSLTPQQIWG